MTERPKKNVFQRAREFLEGQEKDSLDSQVEQYGKVSKRSADSIIAQKASLTIAEELGKTLTDSNPYKQLLELENNTKNAIGILDSQILPMLRVADREALKPRINLFHRITEERLSETIELAYYLGDQMARAEKIKDPNIKEAQKAFTKDTARLWEFTLKELLHTKIRDLVVEAWGKLEKTGVITYDVQVPTIMTTGHGVPQITKTTPLGQKPQEEQEQT